MAARPTVSVHGHSPLQRLAREVGLQQLRHECEALRPGYGPGLPPEGDLLLEVVTMNSGMAILLSKDGEVRPHAR